MKITELYNLYQKNLLKLLQNNLLKKYWFLITEHQFYNNIRGVQFSNFQNKILKDPYLKESFEDKTKLAENILIQGMYFPFFFYQNEEKNIFLQENIDYILYFYIIK